MTSEKSLSTSEIRLVYILLALYTFSLVYHLGNYPLQFEEPYRALVGLEMSMSGDYLYRTAYGVGDFEKPPVYNWILAAFGQASGWSEFGLRLPTVLSLLGFVLALYWWVKTETQNVRLALWSALFLALAGQLYFFYSFLAELNLFHSLVTFLSVAFAYTYLRQQRPWPAFLWLYGLTAVGILTFGLPSVAHLGVTLLGLAIAHRSVRPLLHLAHLAGIALVVLLVGGYFYLYSLQYPLQPYLEGLLQAVMVRVEGMEGEGYSTSQYLQHALSFPAQVLMDLLPGTFLLVAIFFKAARQAWRANPLVRFCWWMLGLQLLIYLLSPDARPRYVHMLYPFMLVPLVVAWQAIAAQTQRLLAALIGLLVGAMGLAMIIGPWTGKVPFPLALGEQIFAGLVGLVLVAGVVWLRRRPAQWPWLLAGGLVASRLVYDQVGVPHRDAPGQEGYFRKLADRLQVDFPGYTIAVHQSADLGYNITYPNITAFYLTRDMGAVVQRTTEVKPEGGYVYFGHPRFRKLFVEQGYQLYEEMEFRGKRIIMYKPPVGAE